MALASTFTLAVGGVAAGAALLLWILEPEGADGVVSAGPGGVGLRF